MAASPKKAVTLLSHTTALLGDLCCAPNKIQLQTQAYCPTLCYPPKENPVSHLGLRRRSNCCISETYLSLKRDCKPVGHFITAQTRSHDVAIQKICPQKASVGPLAPLLAVPKTRSNSTSNNVVPQHGWFSVKSSHRRHDGKRQNKSKSGLLTNVAIPENVTFRCHNF